MIGVVKNIILSAKIKIKKYSLSQLLIWVTFPFCSLASKCFFKWWETHRRCRIFC